MLFLIEGSHHKIFIATVSADEPTKQVSDLHNIILAQNEYLHDIMKVGRIGKLPDDMSPFSDFLIDNVDLDW